MKLTVPKVVIVVLMLALLAGVIAGIVILLMNKNHVDDNDNNNYKFSEKFKIGAASASYQIEGGWDEDGKSPNIWDTITKENPSYVRDQSNGNIAADSYHMYEKDLDALDNIGVS